MLVVFEFKKGSIGYLHHHPHKQVGFLVNGSFEVTINREKKILKAGDAYLTLPDIEHAVVALEESVLIDVFTPYREDFLKIIPMIKSVFQIIILFTLIGKVNAQQSITLIPDFNDPNNLVEWEFDGSGLWKISDGKLVLYKAGVPSGPIRKPSALAILKSKSFNKVVVETEIKSTAPEDVIRRDLDIIVGYESPARFYYIHLSGVNDNVHNGIFLVDNSDRRRIDSGKGKPQLIDFKWHSLRVEWDGSNGLIQVYVDDSDVPVLHAVDKTICCGQAGVGSFDDTGEFKNIVITGVLNE